MCGLARPGGWNPSRWSGMSQDVKFEAGSGMGITRLMLVLMISFSTGLSDDDLLVSPYGPQLLHRT